jgi:hypothetical protein
MEMKAAAIMPAECVQTSFVNKYAAIAVLDAINGANNTQTFRMLMVMFNQLAAWNTTAAVYIKPVDTINKEKSTNRFRRYRQLLEAIQ